MDPATIGFGSAIVGGIFAMGGAMLQMRLDRWWRVRSIRAAVACEIAALVAIARREDYEGAYRAEAETIRAPSYSGSHVALAVPSSQSYFSVFEANASTLGDLPPELAIDVVAFYQAARAWLDAASRNNLPDSNSFTPEEAAARADFMSEDVANLCVTGTQLARRLAPTSAHAKIDRLITLDGLLPAPPSHLVGTS